MGQRLGIAAALLGDPEVLILDEPINGLDPEGIRWIRDLLKGLAAEGRTVFLSSHLMSEMAVTADHLIIIGRGRAIRDIGLSEFVDESSRNMVRVRSPQAVQLRDAILGPDVRVSSHEPSVLEIDGLTAEQVGDAAATHGFVLHELVPERVSLEEAFMDLTREEGRVPEHLQSRTRPPTTIGTTGSPHEHLSPRTNQLCPERSSVGCRLGGRVTQRRRVPLGVDEAPRSLRSTRYSLACSRC